MSKYWIEAKRPEFVRDILRDFCLSYDLIAQQFSKYDQSGIIDFYFFRELLGIEMNQGQLWRLKDTAHLLFRYQIQISELEQLIDWTLGYIFHESIKLKEDAYQQNFYIPWLKNIHKLSNFDSEKLSGVSNQLNIIYQTQESIHREVERIRSLMGQCLDLFIEYLPFHSENPYLARFLFDQNELVKKVFNENYQRLISATYKDKQEKMYVLASKSLRQGGWIQKAKRAIEIALKINPDNRLALQEKEIIASIKL